MGVSGAKKAAFLLMSMEPSIAAELLKSARPEAITRIAAELACLDGDGQYADDGLAETIQEFDTLLQGRKTQRNGRFLQQMLEGAVGKEKTRDLMSHMDELVQAKAPFKHICSLAIDEIAEALAGQSAQVVSFVLAELSPKKSAQLLMLLPEEIRAEAVRGMTSVDGISPQVKLRVASLVMARLRSRSAGGGGGGSSAARAGNQVRKVAILLRSLDTGARVAMVKAICEKDAALGTEVQNLMVTWDDIPTIADRSLQEILRGIDAKKLALSLIGAEPSMAKKIRACISERAVAMVDEESSLLSNPKPEETLAAREEILAGLRELNANGFLNFIES
jgi:flagellar motor switch protein FliG